jgi:hypothetical protein
VYPEQVAPKPRAHRVPRSQPNLWRRFRTHNLLSSTQHGGPIPEDTFHAGCANLRAVSIAEFALVLLRYEAADTGVRDRRFDRLSYVGLPDSSLNRSAFRSARSCRLNCHMSAMRVFRQSVRVRGHKPTYQSPPRAPTLSGRIRPFPQERRLMRRSAPSACHRYVDFLGPASQAHRTMGVASPRLREASAY